MGRRSIDWVRIYVGGEFVEVSWAARNELIGRLEPTSTGASLINLFQRHGTSSIIAPSTAELSVLRDVVWRWMEAVGRDRLPDGIAELRDALVDAVGPSDEAA